VTSNPAGGVDANAATTGLTHSITGLTNGTAYTFTVKATNAVGTSTASAASSSVTPAATIPEAPTIGTATAGNTSATVSFTASAMNGGSAVTGYTVTSRPGAVSVKGTASPLTVTGLTNGTAYTFTVTATNAIGTSAASVASNSAIAGVPGAPIIGAATPGNATASVGFTAPASNGSSAITGYTVTSSPGGLTAKGTASPLTVTGLTNGTAYTFTVTATNAAGTSTASAASSGATPIPVDAKVKAAADKAATDATASLVAAKTAMDSCAALVNKVTSSLTPPGFAASVTADLSNSILAVQYRAAHPAPLASGKPDEIDSKLLTAIPADHLALIVSLKAASAEMETVCKAAAADKQNALMKQAMADVKAAKFDAPGDTAANNKSRTDPVTKGITDYLASSTALAAAMTVLSKDRIHQAYTGPAVQQFLPR
jgi:hypothetical protein